MSITALIVLAGDLAGCATSTVIQSESDDGLKPHKGFIQYSLAESTIVVTASTDAPAAPAAKVTPTSTTSSNGVKIDLTLSASGAPAPPTSTPTQPGQTKGATTDAAAGGAPAPTPPAQPKTDAPDLCATETDTYNGLLGKWLQVVAERNKLSALLGTAQPTVSPDDQKVFAKEIDTYANMLVAESNREKSLPTLIHILSTDCAPKIRITLTHEIMPALGPGYLMTIHRDDLYAEDLNFKVDSKTGLLISASTTTTDQTPEIIANVATAVGEVAALVATNGATLPVNAFANAQGAGIPGNRFFALAQQPRLSPCSDLDFGHTDNPEQQLVKLSQKLKAEPGSNCLNQQRSLEFRDLVDQTLMTPYPHLPIIDLPPPQRYRLADFATSNSKEYAAGGKQFLITIDCKKSFGSQPTSGSADGIFVSRTVGCRAVVTQKPDGATTGGDRQIASAQFSARDPSDPVLMPLERLQLVTRNMGYGFADGAATSAADKHDSPIAVAVGSITAIPGEVLDGVTSAFKKKGSAVDSEASLLTSQANLIKAKAALVAAQASASQATAKP